MKEYLKHNRHLILIVATLYALSCGIACSSDDPTDFDGVRQLILLEGEEYEIYRDELVSSRDQLWDQQVADEEEGDLGLAVFILNARITDSVLFAAFDETELVQTRALTYQYPAPVAEGDAWVAYIIEQVWKQLWSEEMCESMIIDSLMVQETGGSVGMWGRYLESTAPPLLRSIAIYSLGKYPGFRDRASALLADVSAPSLAKFGVFKALKYYKPAFSADLVIETWPYWKDDDYLCSYAFLFLAREADDDSRTYLHQWLLDDELPVGVRLDITFALEAKKNVRDIFVYKKLYNSGTCPEDLLARVTRLLEEKGQI